MEKPYLRRKKGCLQMRNSEEWLHDPPNAQNPIREDNKPVVTL